MQQFKEGGEGTFPGKIFAFRYAGNLKRRIGYTAIGVYSCMILAMMAGIGLEYYIKQENNKKATSITMKAQFIDSNKDKDDL